MPGKTARERAAEARRREASMRPQRNAGENGRLSEELAMQIMLQ